MTTIYNSLLGPRQPQITVTGKDGAELTESQVQAIKTAIGETFEVSLKQPTSTFTLANARSFAYSVLSSPLTYGVVAGVTTIYARVYHPVEFQEQVFSAFNTAFRY